MDKILKYEERSPEGIRYEEYNGMLVQCGSKHIVINCKHTPCSECMISHAVYHVCPGCGIEIAGWDQASETVCECGTWMAVCVDPADGVTVCEYIIPDKSAGILLTKDDTI